MPTLPRLARHAAALVLAASILPSAFADAGADARDARARRFVDEGMNVTLAVCDLPKTCRRQAPLRATQELRETGNDSKIDQRSLAFDGMEIELIYAQDTPATSRAARAEELRHPDVLELTVTTSKWPVAEGLRIGTPRAEVERVLGARGEASDACVTYADVDTQNEALLCYAGDRLVAIKWTQWWDG
jgi:hypothetical protein